MQNEVFSDPKRRPPPKKIQNAKILIIGNIANNGFLLGKILRERGIAADVAAFDYYHINACPEWETASELPEAPDPYFPVWLLRKDVWKKRPTWFYQGPILAVLSALSNSDRPVEKINARRNLDEKLLETILDANYEHIYQAGYIKDPEWIHLHSYRKYWRPIFKIKYYFQRALVALWRNSIRLSNQAGWSLVFLPFYLLLPFGLTLLIQNLVHRVIPPQYREKLRATLRSADLAIMSFGSWLMGVRTGDSPFLSTPQEPMSQTDLDMYRSIAGPLHRALDRYDLVIGFALDGIYPLVSQKPYFAAEHGTIRALPFENKVQGRICNAVYRRADHVLVTNCDNNVAADKLGLELFEPATGADRGLKEDVRRYTFIPHPISEWARPDHQVSSSVRAKFGIPDDAFMIFHPARQCWMPSLRSPSLEKGNDIFLKSLPEALKSANRRIFVLCVEFGQTVEASMALCSALGIESSVVWTKPLIHKQMVDVIAACDLVADQFWIPTFGAIPPKAFMLGKPCLSKFDQKIHEWCFPEMPPILNSDDGISQHIAELASDPSRCKAIGERGQVWYQNYYSNDVLFRRFEEVYGSVVKSTTVNGERAN